ncbi:MAG TPA: hypothetical protein VIA80_09655 [Hyphomonadaceae bacterium]|jgi:hypothetical protein
MASGTSETPPSAPLSRHWSRRVELASHLSQVIASIAVVVSLIYVGIQLAQNTGQLRRAENNATLTQFQAIRLSIIENRDVAELLSRGLYSENALDLADELRLESFLSEFTWSTFHIWDRARSGFLDREEFTRGGAPNLARMLCTPRGAAWWQVSKTQFAAGFAEEVDAAIAAMPSGPAVPGCRGWAPPTR